MLCRTSADRHTGQLSEQELGLVVEVQKAFPWLAD